MPQTLLALLAMILASLLSFSQQRGALSNYEHMIGNEVEMAASGAVMTVLEFIGARSFDERSTPEGILAAGEILPVSESALSTAATFGAADRGSGGCDLMEPFRTPDCDDIDDVDGVQDQVISVTLSTGLTLDFTVSVDVAYIAGDDMGTPSSVQTWNKRVIVTAASDLLPYGAISMERIFAYDPIKAETDYEAVFGPLGS